ncbi:NGFI-A-binding protein-like protein [Operophtera brumata]|uniref:NGFI-A-binding protein-like protein n=1 Tax=Operophtera brumata TaxID=104452 RepID=A0A0L7K4B5_OPEBR|nr:NGFI-A-binding protein-like protein [Operophtera brumata]
MQRASLLAYYDTLLEMGKTNEAELQLYRVMQRASLLAYYDTLLQKGKTNEAELQLYRVMQRASLLAYYDTLLEMGKTNEAELQLYRVMQRASLLAYYDTLLQKGKTNEAELQLYRVMQRASLLAYYDTLLEMGGDDVQQLCDAGEEEFLEIMALVGMASKPLHVRRLQKALQEWVNNPALFQIPIVPNLCTENPFIQCNQRLLNMPPSTLPRSVASPESRPMYSPSPGAPDNSCGSNASGPNASPVHQTTTFSKIVLPPSPAAPVTSTVRPFSPQSAYPPASAGSSPSSVTSPKLSSAAENLSKHLPQLESKPQNTKKKMCKDLELVMAMPETDPRRMEEIRKYAAIYGRFDCKRKPEKPLTLHEVMVNEAAAQICRCVPALLTRRDELFPLARQLVRRAGLHYTKHSLPPTASTGEERERDEDESPAKRPRQVTTHVDLTDS